LEKVEIIRFSHNFQDTKFGNKYLSPGKQIQGIKPAHIKLPPAKQVDLRMKP